MQFLDQYGIYLLGFLGQGLFGARLIVQLVVSERKQAVASPTLFWYLSLLGSFLFMLYGILRNDSVIVFGQILSYFIYVRNIQLKRKWKRLHWSIKTVICLSPIIVLTYVFLFSPSGGVALLQYADLGDPFILMGAAGQLMLNLRFLYQWYYSEKQDESVLPIGFWVISNVASVMVIVYALYRSDIVLLVAQGMGIFVYLRNMIIALRSTNAHDE